MFIAGTIAGKDLFFLDVADPAYLDRDLIACADGDASAYDALYSIPDDSVAAVRAAFEKGYNEMEGDPPQVTAANFDAYSALISSVGTPYTIKSIA